MKPTNLVTRRQPLLQLLLRPPRPRMTQKHHINHKNDNITDANGNDNYNCTSMMRTWGNIVIMAAVAAATATTTTPTATTTTTTTTRTRTVAATTTTQQ